MPCSKSGRPPSAPATAASTLDTLVEWMPNHWCHRPRQNETTPPLTTTQATCGRRAEGQRFRQ
eukprot:6159819-Prymnesium_polylepis.1